uniref:NTR domain-containing protein n=1 Tax=Heterorhabditis bacteriophora TaxID=37862 RepID=A0A1I7WEX1_HETBA
MSEMLHRMLLYAFEQTVVSNLWIIFIYKKTCFKVIIINNHNVVKFKCAKIVHFSKKWCFFSFLQDPVYSYIERQLHHNRGESSKYAFMYPKKLGQECQCDAKASPAHAIEKGGEKRLWIARVEQLNLSYNRNYMQTSQPVRLTQIVTLLTNFLRLLFFKDRSNHCCVTDDEDLVLDDAKYYIFNKDGRNKEICKELGAGWSKQM